MYFPDANTFFSKVRVKFIVFNTVPNEIMVTQAVKEYGVYAEGACLVSQ